MLDFSVLVLRFGLGLVEGHRDVGGADPGVSDGLTLGVTDDAGDLTIARLDPEHELAGLAVAEIDVELLARVELQRLALAIDDLDEPGASLEPGDLEPALGRRWGAQGGQFAAVDDDADRALGLFLARADGDVVDALAGEVLDVADQGRALLELDDDIGEAIVANIDLHAAATTVGGSGLEGVVTGLDRTELEFAGLGVGEGRDRPSPASSCRRPSACSRVGARLRPRLGLRARLGRGSRGSGRARSGPRRGRRRGPRPSAADLRAGRSRRRWRARGRCQAARRGG